MTRRGGAALRGHATPTEEVTAVTEQTTPESAPPPRDHGSATAEVAVTLPVLAVVLALVLWGVGAAVAQVRCQDAARLAARAVARGDAVPSARAAARAAAPDGARVEVSGGDGVVRVRVTVRVTPLPGAALPVPGLPVEAAAVTPREGA